MTHLLTNWVHAVPKAPVFNERYRLALQQEARNDKILQDELRQACKDDILFYINAFVFTFDPRTQDKVLPFVTWPFQDRALLDILECVEQGLDLVIEKSRDMGASWMSLTVMEWLWHFHKGYSFLMVSRKEDLVDAPGDPDSLFWKVDFIHRHLPGWLRPETDRRKLHFGNLGNGSTIDGESTTAAAGVGGRRTAMFIDEFSRIEEGYQLLAGTADTTRCRIFNFTPFGTNNAAFQLARRHDIRKLRLHWSEHPEKARGLYRYNERAKQVDVLDKTCEFPEDFAFILDGRLRSPWYDGECRRRANDREVATMLDIDYQGSEYQFFDKSLILQLQGEYALEPFWEGDIGFDPETGRPTGLVKVSGGPLKLWCHLDADSKPPIAPYSVGCDISTGSGATNSVASCGNGWTGEKVWEYASPFLKAHQMAPRVTALGWLFKDGHGDPAKIAWETPGPGLAFGERVMEMGYPSVYYRESLMDGPFGKTGNKPGWQSQTETKRLLLEQYRAALSMRQFVNRSHMALEECLAYIVKAKGILEHSGEAAGPDGDPTGARVNHGDRVIADALVWKQIKGTVLSVNKGARPDHVVVGSLAWRRLLHHNRRSQDGWG